MTHRISLKCAQNGVIFILLYRYDWEMFASELCNSVIFYSYICSINHQHSSLSKYPVSVQETEQ